MTSKLTLSINEKTIARAKLVSRKQGKSLSKIVEEYLDSITGSGREKKISIREWSNRLKENVNIPENIDYKTFIRENRYQDYLKKEAEMNYTVAADANVFLDVLLHRGEMAADALNIIELAEEKMILVYASSVTCLMCCIF